MKAKFKYVYRGKDGRIPQKIKRQKDGAVLIAVRFYGDDLIAELEKIHAETRLPYGTICGNIIHQFFEEDIEDYTRCISEIDDTP